jgi:hypothetical protein
MKDDFYGWDTNGDGDGDDDDSEENLRRWEAADKRFAELESAYMASQNLTRAKQTEITLLELYIHEMVEEELKKNTFSAAAADLEMQELLQRASRRE